MQAPADNSLHSSKSRPELFAVCLLLFWLRNRLPLQNNGVISLTGVASRWAGWGAAFWLCLFGVIGKTGGLVLSIPDCVLGGATTFLFAAGKAAQLQLNAAPSSSAAAPFL